MRKLSFRNIFRSSKICFNDEGIAVCPYCNGTGLNAEFELLNEYYDLIDFPFRAVCLKCYGKEKTDWIKVLNGRIDDEMDYFYHKALELIPDVFLQFLTFVYNGYRYKIHDERYYQYDNNRDKWIVSELDDWPGHIEGKKEMLFWINKLICADYVRDTESPQEFATKYFPKDIPNTFSFFYHPENDWKWAAKIKVDILNATDLKIEELVRMREELEILGFTIEDLDNILIRDESGEILKPDFVFNWKNLLDKFKLPHRHKYSRIPEGILTIE